MCVLPCPNPTSWTHGVSLQGSVQAAMSLFLSVYSQPLTLPGSAGGRPSDHAALSTLPSPFPGVGSSLSHSLRGSPRPRLSPAEAAPLLPLQIPGAHWGLSEFMLASRTGSRCWPRLHSWELDPDSHQQARMDIVDSHHCLSLNLNRDQKGKKKKQERDEKP